MMLRIIAFVILIFASFYSNAADTIIVHKDQRIDVLTAKQIAINKKPKKKKDQNNECQKCN